MIFDQTFFNYLSEIREASSFEARLASHRGQLIEQGYKVCMQLKEILEIYHLTRKVLSSITQINWMNAVMDMQNQVDRLVYQGFLQQVPEQRLKDYLRYLQGVLKRAGKLVYVAARDQQRMREMAELLQK
ncbi:MAG: DUF3418 domain-containing protein [Candidatus Thiodiazotropha sp. (ex Lucinoma aequizonata)]|nr:DUF3418 domain-containing protein [Candidatus Thiodiazotropha sp. (ex Lucinoma aequizonata)]MCU7889015.1 DUF3418 domain-containing protein [Candidatus Thiodiazotropha sp. (ex Lucinoma aequizonata)]MCU7896548.1 DUF3418 domain-containing protein [Candidatus Thiodiazotropha sp. (ex Lucinoma aequizonata)]MCU7899273.1 DUF3418 domain-containing protein [Candidatus Thiodiazotropha sp. (ex Lucinoma aequizonata)]MCU7902868.1 DUF3418 domain-containing protein [Candidatus Thiodiazotropha sp. (ex Lucino